MRKNETMNIKKARLIININRETHNKEDPKNQNSKRFNAPKISVTTAMDLYPSLCIVIKKI
jgi:hypothetical protein